MPGARDLGKLVEARAISLLPTKMERTQNRKKKSNPDTAGPAWFNMPAAVRTPELEKDIKLLAMRSAIDPKQHYKRGEKILQGKYFQVGTVTADPTGHYSGRLTRRQRGQTILETLMKDTERQQYFKKKFSSLQEANIRAGRAPRVHKQSRGTKKQ